MIQQSNIIETLALAFALSQNVKVFALLLGLASVVGGVLALQAQKRQLDEVEGSAPSERERLYESRKFRRRGMVSTLIASQGIMLCGIAFVEEVRTLAILVSIILLMLVGVLGAAMFDFFSVGLKELARRDDDSARKKLVDEYVRQRERLQEQQEESDDVGSDESH